METPLREGQLRHAVGQVPVLPLSPAGREGVVRLSRTPERRVSPSPVETPRTLQEGSILGRAEALTQLLHQALGLLVLCDVGEQLPAEGKRMDHLGGGPEPTADTRPGPPQLLLSVALLPQQQTLLCPGLSLLPAPSPQGRVHPTLLRNLQCDWKLRTKQLPSSESCLRAYCHVRTFILLNLLKN